MTFMDVWIGYAVVGVSLFSAAFVWAVRNKQFSDLDRARHIALKAAEPIEAEPEERRISRLDRYGLLAVLAAALGVFASAIWIGIRCLGHGACHP